MDALYRKQILDYAHVSKKSSELDQPTHSASYNNSICGDSVDVSLKVKNGNVEEMGLKVRGCALCEAGAGLALKCLPGQSEERILELSEGFTDWIAGRLIEPPIPSMEHFQPLLSINSRHKCVLLAFHATVKAITKK